MRFTNSYARLSKPRTGLGDNVGLATTQQRSGRVTHRQAERLTSPLLWLRRRCREPQPDRSTRCSCASPAETSRQLETHCCSVSVCTSAGGRRLAGRQQVMVLSNAWKTRALDPRNSECRRRTIAEKARGAMIGPTELDLSSTLIQPAIHTV